MEPQTTNETQNKFNKVTPFSKALAAILFIILPFVGLYIGYTYAPEKVSDTETSGSLEVLINSLDNEKVSITGDRDTKKTHLFRNANLQIVFTTDRFLGVQESIAKDNIEIFLDMKTMSKYDSVRDQLYEARLRISAGSRLDCFWGLCNYPNIETVSIGIVQYEYLGPVSYCDVGQCAGYEYVYRFVAEDYNSLLMSDKRLHNFEGITIDIIETLDSLGIKTFN